jgi:hypothetical protein
MNSFWRAFAVILFLNGLYYCVSLKNGGLEQGEMDVETTYPSDLSKEDYPPNINGVFSVSKNRHYSNKTTVIWGRNNQTDWSVLISLSETAATYDCTNTSSYVCTDPKYYNDWNKLWGKARCGYDHDHHDDSDRFVFRKCSDPTCDFYQEGKTLIVIGAYSYDNSQEPFIDPNLNKPFKTLVAPNVFYKYQMIMDETGLTTFILKTAEDVELERTFIQHNQTCVENYYEGTVNGLYFGGTCMAPVEIIAEYKS